MDNLRTQRRSAEVLLPVAILLLAVLLTRLPLILACFHGYYFVDELQLVQSTLDRLLGIPHTAEHWSGAFFQFLFLPVLGVDFLFASHFRPSPQALTTWIGASYVAPWHAVALARLLTTGLFAVGCVAVYAASATVVRARWVVLAFVLVLATLPFQIIQGVFASSDGPATGVYLMAIAATIFAARRPSRVPLALAGVLFGLTVATRTIFAPAGLFLLCAALQGRQDKLKAAVTFCAFVVLGFVAACPYCWTDPMRFAKATVGNYIKTGSPAGAVVVLHCYHAAVPDYVTLGFVVALVAAVFYRQWLVATGAILSVGAVVLPSLHAPLVEPRYFISVPLTMLGACVVVAGAVQARRPDAFTGRWPVPVLLVFAVLGLALAMPKYAVAMREDADLAAVHACENALRPGDRVVAETRFQTFLTPIASAASAQRRVDRMAASLQSAKGLAFFTTAYHLPPAFVTTFKDALNEDDQSALAELRAMTAVLPTDGHDLEFCGGDPGTNDRLGLLGVDDAVARFRAGQADVLFLSGPALPGLPVVASGGAGDAQWFVYRRP